MYMDIQMIPFAVQKKQQNIVNQLYFNKYYT